MKKIIISAIAVIAAATLCACGSSSTVNEAVNAAKQKKIENMSYELAAGNYKLVDMTDLGSDKTDLINEDSYTENTITLFENGEFVFTVALDENAQTKTGSYQITQNGVVTLDADTYIASKAEAILCDGETLIFDGKLGSQKAVSLVYKKAVAEEENTLNESENTEIKTDAENQAEENTEIISEDNTQTTETEG